MMKSQVKKTSMMVVTKNNISQESGTIVVGETNTTLSSDKSSTKMTIKTKDLIETLRKSGLIDEVK